MDLGRFLFLLLWVENRKVNHCLRLCIRSSQVPFVGVLGHWGFVGIDVLRVVVRVVLIGVIRLHALVFAIWITLHFQKN